MLQHCLIMKQRKEEKKVTATTEKSSLFYTSAFPASQMIIEANRRPDKGTEIIGTSRIFETGFP